MWMDMAEMQLLLYRAFDYVPPTSCTAGQNIYIERERRIERCMWMGWCRNGASAATQGWESLCLSLSPYVNVCVCVSVCVYWREYMYGRLSCLLLRDRCLSLGEEVLPFCRFFPGSFVFLLSLCMYVCSDVYPEEMHSFEKMLTMEKKDEFDVRSFHAGTETPTRHT